MHSRLVVLLLAFGACGIASPLAAQGLLAVQPVDSPALPPLLPYLRGCAAGDLDNDGDEDLAVCDNGEAAVYWSSGGQFARTLLFADVNAAPTVTAVADFDGDGFLDLLFGPYGSSSLPRLRFWWGDGTQAVATGPTSDVPIPGDFLRARLAIADFDHDGDADIVLTKPPGALLHSSIYLQSLGNRTFGGVLPSYYPFFDCGDCFPFAVDVDGDTWDDIVVVSRNGRSRLFWNNAGAGFAEALSPQFPVVQQSLRGLAVGDFDGDGLRDLVFGGDDGAGVLVRATGPRQFAVATGSPPPPARCVALHAADVDGDGKDDVYAFRRERGNLLRSDGNGGFPLVEAFGGCDDTIAVTAADLDGDGDRDFLRVGQARPTFNLDPQPRLAASYAVRDGLFEHVGASRLPASTAAIVPSSGDVDGDGLPDLLLRVNDAEGGQIESYEFAVDDGRGVFAYEHVQRLGLMNGGFFADLDGDGRDELVLPGTSTGYLANVQGTLAATPTPLPVTGQMAAAGALDLEGDGDVDLVFFERFSGVAGFRVLVQSAGAWQDATDARVSAPTLPFGSTSSLRFVVADFDGDLDADVIARSDRGEMLLRNDAGVLTFAPGAIEVVPVGAVGIHASAADLDGDGDLDLSSGRGLWLNDGAGRFANVSSRVPNVSGHDWLGRTADVDDDGDVDLVGNQLVCWNDGHAFFSVASGVSPIGALGGGAYLWSDVDRDGDTDMVGLVSGGRPQVYTNMLRQLVLTSAARLGGTLDFRYHAQAGQTAQPMLVWFGCSLARVQPTWLPAFGWLQVDVARLIPVGPFALPAQGGDLVHALPLPNDPALQGTFFCAQPVELRGARWRIGNFVETRLGR